MDLKPGAKTTEFWMTMGATVLGLLGAFGVISPEQATGLQTSIGQLAGGIIGGLGVLGYSISRGIAKKDATAKPPGP